MARKLPTETAKALGDILSGRGISQTYTASASGYSQPYINQIVRGRRKPSPEWIETIANTLKLAKHERARLHLAAAKDHGFKL